MLPYVKLFRDASETIDLLSDAEAGRLLKALMHYANDQQETLPGQEKLVFAMLRAQMDRDAAAYEAYCEKQRENGSKGGRPPKEKPTGSEENPENPTVIKKTQKTLTGKEKEKDMDRTTKSGHGQKPTGSGKPTVRDYEQRTYTEEELEAVSGDVIIMALEEKNRAKLGRAAGTA